MPEPITNWTLVIGSCIFDGSTAPGHGPIPSKLKVDIQDVDFDSGRTADGVMHRNRVATKYKIELGWPAMEPDKVARCLQAVTADQFQVTFLSPLTNSSYTGTFYAGDRSVPVYNYQIGLYDAFGFNLVEF